MKIKKMAKDLLLWLAVLVGGIVGLACGTLLWILLVGILFG